MNRIALCLMVLCLGGSALAADAHTKSKKALLAAIDIPLTPTLVEQHDLNAPFLMSIIMSPTAALYTRGRAIAALGMRRELGIGTHLEFIIQGSFSDVLKDQAIVSLAKGWGRQNPGLAMTILANQAAIQSGRLRTALRREFAWLQAQVGRREAHPTSAE
ncbi:MAG: hypothetical protein VX589_04455 [Myxococcota bacterium]|nr:hypothetical protein [Myxococcota bacterium]